LLINFAEMAAWESRVYVVLTFAEPILADWPVAARIAFRDALLADPSRFASEPFDPGETVTAVYFFRDCWDRGVRWPPTLHDIAGAEIAPLIEAFGVAVALQILSAARSG
jgi:hypothetical protein